VSGDSWVARRRSTHLLPSGDTRATFGMVLDSFDQAWPPFVLVIGLLLVGKAANGDGLFGALGARIAAAPLSPLLLFSSLLALVAAVTAVLNLDTSVVFRTPVLVHGALLVLMLPSPALPVLALGPTATAAQRRLPRIGARALGPLFALTVALGLLARAYNGPADLLGHADRWSTAGLAGLTANLVNNLPAAALFSAQRPPHPRALLLGLDLGPNLAVTGSLSAFLWFQAACAAGARPSVHTYSRLGLVLTPLCLAVTTVLLFL